jgi:hypothetical protein
LIREAHKVFAHNRLADMALVNEVFANTNVEEIKGIFGFLHALYVLLDQLFINGRPPNVRPYVFKLPPNQAGPCRLAPGESTYREGQAMLNLLLSAPERDINATSEQIQQQ